MQRELMPYAESFWSDDGPWKTKDGDIILRTSHLKHGESWDDHTVTGFMSIDGPVIDLICSCGGHMGVTFRALNGKGFTPTEMMEMLKQMGIPEVQRPDSPEVQVILATLEVPNLEQYLTPLALDFYGRRCGCRCHTPGMKPFTIKHEVPCCAACGEEYRYLCKKIRLSDGGMREEYVRKLANTLNRLVDEDLVWFGTRGPAVFVELPPPKSDLVDELNKTPPRLGDQLMYAAVILWVYSKHDPEKLNQFLGNRAFIAPGTVGDEDWTGL